jgi:hypothetical protein
LHDPARRARPAYRRRDSSIEGGKSADRVLWDANPFSFYARVQQVYIDGYRYYDRSDPQRQPATDFALHQAPRGGE